MTAKSWSLIFGVIFIAVGCLGFIDNPIIADSDKAMFHADKLHDFVHIGSGILFLLFGMTGSASGFLILFGLVYLALGVIGLIQFGTGGMGKIFGILHVNGADNFLHIALGLVIFIAGAGAKRAA